MMFFPFKRDSVYETVWDLEGPHHLMRKVDGCCGLKTNGNRKKKNHNLSVESISPCQAPKFSMSTFQPLLMVQKSKKQTTWDVKRPCESWDFNYQNLKWWVNPWFLVAIKQHGSHDIMEPPPFPPSSKVKTLKTIMEENGHKHIDILKVPSGGYPWLGANFGLAWDAAGWLRFYFEVFSVDSFLLATFFQRGHAHMVVKLVRAHTVTESAECSETSKFTSDRWPSRKVHDPRSSDLCLRPCRTIVGRKGWKAVSQMAVFE